MTIAEIEVAIDDLARMRARLKAASIPEVHIIKVTAIRLGVLLERAEYGMSQLSVLIKEVQGG
jgi:hypothetical protein